MYENFDRSPGRSSLDLRETRRAGAWSAFVQIDVFRTDENFILNA